MQVHLVDGTYELFRHYYAPARAPRPDGRRRRRRPRRRRLGARAARGGRHPRRRRHRPRHRVVPQRPLGRLQDGRRHRPRAVRAVPAARGRAARRSASRCGPMVELEADDALAPRPPRSPRPTTRVERVVICTPDKDLAQCVARPAGRPARPPAGQVCRRGRRCARSSASARRRSPTGWRSWATAPTASPACPGWGAKSAAAVLARYGTSRRSRRSAATGTSTCAAPPSSRRPSTSSGTWRRCSRCSPRCGPTPTSARVDDVALDRPDARLRRLGRAPRLPQPPPAGREGRRRPKLTG